MSTSIEILYFIMVIILYIFQQDKLNLQCVHNSAIQELMRGIRAQFESLAPGIPSKELTAMTLGLAHR